MKYHVKDRTCLPVGCRQVNGYSKSTLDPFYTEYSLTSVYCTYFSLTMKTKSFNMGLTKDLFKITVIDWISGIFKYLIKIFYSHNPIFIFGCISRKLDIQKNALIPTIYAIYYIKELSCKIAL